MRHDIDGQIENCIERGRLVVGTIDTHLPAMSYSLGDLAGMDTARWRGLFEELRDELAAATVHLEYTHDRLSDCIAEAASRRHALDLATQHLHIYMMKIRDVLIGHGLATSETPDDLPMDAEQLVAHAKRTSDALSSVNHELECAADVEALTRDLQSCERTLHDHIDTARRKELPVQSMLKSRAHAQATWTLAHRRVGGIFHHALTLTNCSEAAEFVRPAAFQPPGKQPRPSMALLEKMQIRPPGSAPRIHLRTL